MAFAYHILAHKNYAQVNQLLETLWHADDLFVLHFDKRADAELHQVGAKWQNKSANVIIQLPRVVKWGSGDLMNAQHDGIQIALDSGVTWTHFITLSGQCFPLTSRADRLAKAKETPEATFLDIFNPTDPGRWRNAHQRIERFYLHLLWLQTVLKLPGVGRRIRTALGWQNTLPFIPFIRRRWPKSWQYRGGSDFLVLSRKACRYLVDSEDAIEMHKWLQHALIPDEIFFQTVLYNSEELRPSLVNQHWHYTDFSGESTHPHLLQTKDFTRLISSGKLFARKFDTTVDDNILLLLQDRILN